METSTELISDEQKVLVIHPKDESTDFLYEIYKGKGYTTIWHNPTHKELKLALESHDKIIMLGHGDHHGLYGYGRMIIDSKLVYILRKKEVFAVWCNADVFVEKYKLNGAYTGMIISEECEAIYEGISSLRSDIESLNFVFSKAMRLLLETKNIEVFNKAYNGSDEVSKFNRSRVYI